MIESKKISSFRQINDLATKGGVVFVGADFFASMPIVELAQLFHIDEQVHNRSFFGATAADIAESFELILDLKPEKIFINLGEIEASRNENAETFIASFSALLDKITGETYVVSIAENSPLHKRYNDALKALCSKNGVKFIDVAPAFNGKKTEIDVFKAIKFYIPRHLDFVELMTMR